MKKLKKYLNDFEAGLYILPEGFFDTETFNEINEYICLSGKRVLIGYKDLKNNGEHSALLYEYGKLTDSYKKCILTKGEKEKGKEPGKGIRCINSVIGLMGVPICYEIHFPEVVRILSLENPLLMVNIIGTGMYHKTQADQWLTIAKTRAIENEIFVLGTTHCNGEIPIAFCFDPDGKTILEMKCKYGGFLIDIDLEKSHIRKLDYFSDRVPDLFNNKL